MNKSLLVNWHEPLENNTSIVVLRFNDNTFNVLMPKGMYLKISEDYLQEFLRLKIDNGTIFDYLVTYIDERDIFGQFTLRRVSQGKQKKIAEWCKKVAETFVTWEDAKKGI